MPAAMCSPDREVSGSPAAAVHRKSSRGTGSAVRTWLLCAGIAACSSVSAQDGKSTLQFGSATVQLAPKGADARPPAAQNRVPALQRLPVPTNQWYSSLLFSEKPEPLFAQPLSFLSTPGGFEIALPTQVAEPTERRDVDIHFPHRHPLTVRPLAFEPSRAKLAAVDDWSIALSLGPEPAGNSGDEFKVTIGHGLPYAQFRVSRGPLGLKLPSTAQRLPASDPRTLLLRSGHQTFAVFGPTGVQWQQRTTDDWMAVLPPGANWLAVTVLPDDEPATLDLLERHARVFVENTRVTWKVDLTAGTVRTDFIASTAVLEGPPLPPLLGLYPHHWHDNPSVANRLGPTYRSVRGPIRLLAAPGFEVTRRHEGFVPHWPAVSADAYQDVLRAVMERDLRDARRMMLQIGEGAYWQGKGLQRLAKMLDVFDVHGTPQARERLRKLMHDRIEQWFSGADRKRYFQLDRSIGTLLAHPEEYFAIGQMNDHHFHYGYWIRTIAELALREPAWAGPQKWGPMVDLMIADIATTRRNDERFPFLRHFDAYEGHSWASGVALGPWGNNQESSSEAINAWVGLILWGEIRGDTALRDLGIWLYTTESQAIDHYWFDRHRLVFPPEYPHVETSMLFGSRYSHNTWWTDEPRQIKGINLLPITTASTYLGRDPAYIKRNLATLPSDTKTFESRGKRADPPDIWQDLFAKYLALADPGQALAEWNRWGAVELGDSRTHTLHWLLSLAEMGVPDASVHADTTFHAVFRRGDGTRTYLAYNATGLPITVRFSDGQSLSVGPRSLARLQRAQP